MHNAVTENLILSFVARKNVQNPHTFFIRSLFFIRSQKSEIKKIKFQISREFLIISDGFAINFGSCNT